MDLPCILFLLFSFAAQTQVCKTMKSTCYNTDTVHGRCTEATYCSVLIAGVIPCTTHFPRISAEGLRVTSSPGASGPGLAAADGSVVSPPPSPSPSPPEHGFADDSADVRGVADSCCLAWCCHGSQLCFVNTATKKPPVF